MSKFVLKNLTRGQAIVEFEGAEYNVNGEGYGDGTWEIFPQMVYCPADNGKWALLKDEKLKEKVVAALRANWNKYHPAWSLLPESE